VSSLPTGTRRGPWKRFWVFYALSLAFLGLVPLLSACFGTSMDFGSLAARASEATGVPWTSSLWDVVRLCLAEPGLWLLLVGSAAPAFAALAVLAAARDTSQWRAFVRRLRPVGLSGGSIRSELGSYALLVVSIVLCLLTVFALRQWMSPGEYTQTPIQPSWALLSALVFAALLDQGAVLEEAGWRGFGTPHLQAGLLDPLRAALLIGILWGLWHVPRDVVSGLVQQFGLVKYAFVYLPAFTLGTISVSIIAAYFMNRLGGSLIPAVMVHGLSNDAVGFAGMATIERALTPDHQLSGALPFLALSIGIVILSGRELGRRPQGTQEP
jgi:hypothetical protein